MARVPIVAEIGRMDTAGERRKRRGKPMRPDQGRKLAERWRASGLTATEYSRRHGVNFHVLRYWAARSSKSKTSTRASDFFVLSAGQNPPSVPRDRNQAGERVVAAGHSRAVVIVVPLQDGREALTEALRVLLAEEGT